MNANFIQYIAGQLSLRTNQVENTVRLLEEGATVPFISRYRKEMTGSMDEVQIGAAKDLKEKLEELEKRKQTILKTIGEQGKLTNELEVRIEKTFDLRELEDIYLPYKPRKRTRAAIAREKGLEPLARIIFKQYERDLEQKAAAFVNDQVPSEEDALSGASDIIAEWISDDEEARNRVRSIFRKEAVIISKVVKGKEEEGIKYRDYFEMKEALRRCPSHRLLAMRRGEKEGFLKISVAPDEEPAIERLVGLFVKGSGPCQQLVESAVTDAYHRLLGPSIENEFATDSREKAEADAIRVFAENLRQLLLSSPLGEKRVLALDPGYRTGCKLVCLDEQGTLIHNETIYPHPPQSQTNIASRKVSSLIDAYKIDAIAIGNGTAGRETERFVKNIPMNRKVLVFVVSEDGASVYSASKTAREEFPEYDVTVRGAVSIGRRLMDPLAELVKIEPKSIGVGQYQHDVDQKKLQHSLDGVVESCVNLVGVNVNTASRHLLTYVSGLGPQLAQNIVDYRREKGPFESRKQLRKVPRLGDKAFEQCAGFLRISGAKNPLDNSAVHPEAYPIVEKMARDLNCTVPELIIDEQLRKKIRAEDYRTEEIGLPTLYDILKELDKPGRDPRQAIKVFEFADGIFSINDLKVGMTLPGIVTNITRFGAFVDVGVKQDGLVHVSELADRFVSDPSEVVKLNQHVRVKVLEVDVSRKRIQLSMKQAE